MEAMKWKPTHRLTYTGANGMHRMTWDVMLVDGCGYTQSEWEAADQATWELVKGRWRFQGEVAPRLGTIKAERL